jgi:hypothetical protein
LDYDYDDAAVRAPVHATETSTDYRIDCRSDDA